MVGTRKLDRLLTHAERSGAKVVLVGDPRQLPEIDAGGTLAALARRLDPIQLTANRRQNEAWEREALDQLRHGDVTVAVNAYHRAGRITLTDTADSARQVLVDDWWNARQDPTATEKTAAMYALTRAEVDDLNQRARTHLRHAGGLDGDDVTIAGRDFAVGDQVLALRNDRRLGVRNGTTGTLTAITPSEATIATPDGATVTLTAEYLEARWLTQGYATTIHKSQGDTVDRAFLLGSDQLFREAGYVALSRARNTTRLYLVDPDTNREPTDQLVSSLSASRAQTLASDQLPPPAADHQTIDAALAVRRSVLADPPTWAIDTIGPPPLWGPDRERWADTATRIAAYRDTYPDRPPGLTDRRGDRNERDKAVDTAIGPEPTDPIQHRAWTLARLSLTQTRHHGLDRDLNQGLTR
jgi:hypothetical protein